MSAIISALLVLLQPVTNNTSVPSAFFHDLVQFNIPFGRHVELRAPIGEIPDILAKAVHQTEQATITVSVGEERNPIPKQKLQLVVIELQEDLIKLNRTSRAGFTPLAESLVVMILPPGYGREKIVTALSLCWRSSFGSCTAVCQPDPDIPAYDIYYSALELNVNKRCTTQHAPPTRVNRWVLGKGFLREKQPKPQIRDFKGCHILVAPNYVQPYFFHKFGRRHKRVSLLEPLSHYDGLDASILSIIAQKYNLTVLVMSKAMLQGRAQGGIDAANDNDEDDFAKVAADGSDAFAAVLQGDADIVAGGFVPTEWRFKITHVTRAYGRDVLMWYIRADEDDTWHRLTICFSTTVWILLGAAFCTTATLRLLIASHHDDPHPILTLWSLSTESGRHPNYRTASEIVLGVAWIVFSLHVNSAYRAGLATSLASGPLYEDITTDQLYSSDFTLFLPVALEAIVGDLLHEHRGRRLRCSSSKHDCIQALKNRSGMALLINSNMMRVEGYLHLIDFKTGLPKFRSVPGHVLLYPIQMYMAKGHMMRPIFDEILQVISDAGFSVRFMSMALAKGRRRRIARKSEDVPLTLYQLQGAFALLLTGFGIAFMVALAEASTVFHKDTGTLFTKLQTDIGMRFQLVRKILGKGFRRVRDNFAR